MATDSQVLLVVGGDVLTMNRDREILIGATVACEGSTIVAIGSLETLQAQYPSARKLDATGCVVMPGLVNAHQHTTCDALLRSCIPDLLAPGESIFSWSVPAHEALTAEDDEVAAALTALSSLRSGTTMLVESGTVAHPEAAVAGLEATGIRATIGRWGWDQEGLPFAEPVDEVLQRQAELVAQWPKGGRIEGWVTLVGHDLISDELLAGAGNLSRQLGVGLTMHMSPTSSDAESYLDRHGRRPLEHLADLGVLGPNVLISHGVWLDDAEVAAVLEHDVAIAYCPWAYLRLGQGTTVAGRHGDILDGGGRLALGCDACNAGDHHDVFSTAALAIGLIRDGRVDPESYGAHRALELATIDGAAAIGKAEQIGSIEIGKAADMVVINTSNIDWSPRGDLALGLIWGGGARHVRDVVVDGEIVLQDGHSTKVDEQALMEAATERHEALLKASGLTVPSPWPKRVIS